MNSKAVLRKKIADMRSRLTDREVEAYSVAVTEKLGETQLYRDCQYLCIYQAFRNEVSCEGIMRMAFSQGKKVYVPVTVAERRNMEFYRITENTIWKKGTYGIKEPVLTEGASLLEERALILMPGLVFDRNKHRIGYGGGYYDRYLASHPEHCTIALCYPFQITEENLPVEPHDILPDYIMTAEEIF